MNIVKQIGEYIHRCWHAKGFGIHSPFAFKFITEIVHCRYSYYGYIDIENWLSAGWQSKERHDARLLLRIVARLQPTVVWLGNHTPEAIKQAVVIADSQVEVKTISGCAVQNQLFYVDLTKEQNNKTTIEHLDNALHSDQTIIVIRHQKKDAAIITAIAQKIESGIALRDSELAILIIRRNMAKNEYYVKL